jgi:hypothetical protein
VSIEVESSRTVRHTDANHLKVFLSEYADRADGGLVLYAGTESYWIADRVLAVPW